MKFSEKWRRDGWWRITFDVAAAVAIEMGKRYGNVDGMFVNILGTYSGCLFGMADEELVVLIQKFM